MTESNWYTPPRLEDIWLGDDFAGPMPDTYWIGVDLDGTLAFEDDWRGIEHIGEPIPRMVERVKALIADGHDVRIFTARASRLQTDEERTTAIRCVEDWCEKHLGKRLPVTNEKDHFLKYFFDDRAIAVECNTGCELSNGTIKPLPIELE